MNERMKALCQNAFQEVHESRVGTDGLIKTDGNPYIFYEKFAEMIVRECLEFVDPGSWSNNEWDQALIVARENIKGHFGIE